VAVELAGDLPGTLIDNLTIHGFTETGILCIGPRGFRDSISDSEVVLKNLELRAGKPKAVGIRFRSGKNDPSGILIAECRFFGPMAAGIAFQSETHFVTIRESIFAETVGLKFVGANQILRDIAVANNSFFKVSRGIVFSKMPLLKNSNHLSFTDNLFAGIRGPEAVLEVGDPLRFLELIANNGISGNCSSWLQPKEPGKIDLFGRGIRGADFKFVSTNPENARFLEPASGGPHTLAGAVKPKP